MRLVTLEKLAKALSRKYKIKLHCKGDKAYTDGSNITLPYLGEEISEELATVLRGYCDHEVGHVKHSNFEKDFRSLITPAVRKMQNQIEDFRIEKLMGQEYVGVHNNLTKLNIHLMPEKFDSALSCLWMEGFRQCAGQTFDLPDHTRPVMKLFGKDIFDRLNNLRSHEDSLELAFELIDKVKEGFEEPEMPELTPGEAGEEEESGEAVEVPVPGEAGDSEDVEESGEIDAESSNDRENSEAGGTEETEETEDSDDEEAGEGGVAGDGEATEDSEDEEASEESEAGEEATGEPNPYDESHDTLDAAEVADEEDFAPITEEDIEEWETKDERIKEILEAAHDTAMGGYSVYDAAQDRVVDIKPDGNMYDFNRMKEELGNYNTLKARIARMFVAKTQSRWVNDREEGRINGRKLASVKAGNRRVFREHKRGESKDTAITFLADFSASMGYKARNEMKAVILFLETLKLTSIKSEVLCYTTGGRFRGMGYDGTGYSRIEKLYTGVFKSFDENYTSKIKRRIANWSDVRQSENCDPCSVRVAHDRLMKRREKRKILFVLTDGAVANKGDTWAGKMELKRLVKEIEDKGRVEIICIDFGSYAAKDYYSNVIDVARGGEIAEAIGAGLKDVFGV